MSAFMSDRTPEERRYFRLQMVVYDILRAEDGGRIVAPRMVDGFVDQILAAFSAEAARSTGGQLGPGTTPETAEIASLRNQLEGAKEALMPFGEVGAHLPAMSGDPCHEVICKDGIRRAITDKHFRLAASTLYRLEGDQEIGSENASLRTTLHGADTEAESSAASDPSTGGGA